MLVLDMVVSCAHGLDPRAVWARLRGAGLLDQMTPLEWLAGADCDDSNSD